VDILIMILVAVVAFLAYRGASRRLVIGLWFLAIVAMLGLFRYHVTSHLHLNF